MTRHLFLLRHGKSAWPDGVADHARPLAQRGRAAVPLMAKTLARLAGSIDRALVSDARRTLETFGLLADAFPGLKAELEPAIYDARAATLLELVRATPDRVTRLLMVGHNPGFQVLGSDLADPAASDPDALARLRRKLPTAGLVHLAFDASWRSLAPGAARLADFVTPAMLGGIDED